MPEKKRLLNIVLTFQDGPSEAFFDFARSRTDRILLELRIVHQERCYSLIEITLT